MTQRDHARILIYSPDTFGLGRLRRCLAVANALAGQFKGLFVLIISGTQVPTAMGLRARVDFVKIPSVIKLYDGQYTSMGEHIDLRDTLAIRRTIIRNTAESFDPDLMIVDDELCGLAPEIHDTLEMLKSRDCKITLALPDLIDTTLEQRKVWKRTKVVTAIDRIYDHIWIYGAQRFARPLEEVDAPAKLLSKVTYTGYLRRNIPRRSSTFEPPFTNPYILVTTDDSDAGADLMDWMLTAYEHDATLPHPCLLVLNPLLPAAKRKIIRGRTARMENVRVIEFEEGTASLMPGAVGVVTTPEYDAFCQLLSFDKRAILVPQNAGRPSQENRAARAAELKLARTIAPAEARDPYLLAEALHAFPTNPLPSRSGCADMLTGLETICSQIGQYIKHPAQI